MNELTFGLSFILSQYNLAGNSYTIPAVALSSLTDGY